MITAPHHLDLPLQSGDLDAEAFDQLGGLSTVVGAFTTQPVGDVLHGGEVSR